MSKHEDKRQNNKSDLSFLKTIQNMQPDTKNAREKRRHKINHKHGFYGLCNEVLDSLSFPDIFIGGFTIILVVILGLNYYSSPTQAKPAKSVHHSIKHHNNLVIRHYHGQPISERLKHYNMSIKLSPEQVAFFNQFYYSDRSRRNYTKIKDVYNARMSHCKQLVKKYSVKRAHAKHNYKVAKKQFRDHKTSANRRAVEKYGYLITYYDYEIKFYKDYEVAITKRICKQYPHFREMYRTEHGFSNKSNTSISAIANHNASHNYQHYNSNSTPAYSQNNGYVHQHNKSIRISKQIPKENQSNTTPNSNAQQSNNMNNTTQNNQINY